MDDFVAKTKYLHQLEMTPEDWEAITLVTSSLQHASHKTICTLMPVKQRLRLAREAIQDISGD
jgi:hypothetical protein